MIDLELAVKQAKGLLGNQKEQEESSLERAAKASVDMLLVFMDESPETDDLEKYYRRVIKHLHSIYRMPVTESTMLEEFNPDHEEWLSNWTNDHRAADGETDWKFYKSLENYLDVEEGRPTSVLTELDRDTDKILKRLENPNRAGKWDTRGMVIGNVQAGKTENYSGLICKAADVGYQIIVVLGGHTNALRNQTQKRLDRNFLGVETQVTSTKTDQISNYIGAGKPEYRETHLPAIPATQRSEINSNLDEGDFTQLRSRTFRPAQGHIGKVPLLFVIKKHTGILGQFIAWSKSLRDEVQNLPLLLIDDEADYASVDTSKPEEDPSRTNSLIREILSIYSKSGYVAYTATPFANMFIDAEAEHPVLGKDIFPRHFMLNLPTKPNYIGPESLFGKHDGNTLDESEALPLKRQIPISETWIIPKHSKEFQPGPLPDSMKEAIRSFILSVAVRRVRGMNDHNSMLVHVSRYQNVQRLIADQISRELFNIRRGLNREKAIINDFKNLWENDFVPTGKKIRRMKGDHFPAEPVEPWQSVKDVLSSVVNSIEEVKIFNGDVKDTLDYERDDGKKINVIAVGGDRLSRGLTLEGLTTCYFMRQTFIMDTLLQMGRWFGYRDDYIDACRIYSEKALFGLFKKTTLTILEVQNLFDEMYWKDRTPMDFMLRVRADHQALKISGAGKLRQATNVAISHKASLQQTTMFERETGKENREALNTFIRKLQSKPEKIKEGIMWRDIDGIDVARFIKDTGALNKKNKTAYGEILSRYIVEQIGLGELTNWSILLINNSSNEQKYGVDIGGYKIGITTRTDELDDETGKPVDPDFYRIGILTDPKHEQLDLPKEDRDKALKESIKTWKNRGGKKSGSSSVEVKKPENPSGESIRSIRNPRNGFMILYPIISKLENYDGRNFFVGHAVSFPDSQKAPKRNYLIPQWQLNKQLEFDI